MNIFQQAKK